MVGLPARGKSYISKALLRYLNLIGVPTKIFNAGNKRRDDGHAGTSAAFFDPANKDAKALKERMAMETLDDLLGWLKAASASNFLTSGHSGSVCAIFDATNTTPQRRRAVAERCAAETPEVTLIWVESVTDDEELLQHNYRMKLANDDYRGRDAEAALVDFVERVRQYEKVYEPLATTEGLPFIRMTNAGEQFLVHRVHDGARRPDYVISRCVALLHSLHLAPRAIWIALCGQSLNDRNGILGGDTVLSAEGQAYSRALAERLAARAAALAREDEAGADGDGAQQGDGDDPGSQHMPACTLLTGTYKRYTQLVEMLRHTIKPTAVSILMRLNDLCAGTLDSTPVAELAVNHADEVSLRQADKLNYRFPGSGGESYQDVVQRLLDVILTIEQTRSNVVVVCDRAVGRVLTGYLRGVSTAEIPNLEVKPGILELRRSHGGFVYTHIEVPEGEARDYANLFGKVAK